MNDIIITMLITAGVIFIAGGIGFWVFTDWLENNGEDQ